MVKPQLLLMMTLLSKSVAIHDDAFSTSLQLVCGDKARPGVAVQAERCPLPPCTTSAKDLTLALPVLLTLHGWSTELWLFNATGHGSGVARLRLDVDKASLEAASCIEGRYRTSVACTSQTMMRTVHVEVVAARREATLTLLLCHDSLDGVVTLNYDSSPSLVPSVVMVLHSQRFGYSAVTPAMQSLVAGVLVLATTVLTATCVVVSVAMLVFVWRAWSGVAAVQVMTEGEAESQHQEHKD